MRKIKFENNNNFITYMFNKNVLIGLMNISDLLSK